MSDFNLGTVTAYGYAKDKGYTGTEDEYAELMASYADVAEQAAESATQAAASATTASTKASEAAASATAAASSKTAAETAQGGAETAAQTATTKAGEASASATTASGKATEATTAAGTATTKASEATTAATTATTKAGEASTSATNAAASATRAQEILDSIPADYSQLSDDVEDLKDGLTAVETQLEQTTADALAAYVVDTASGAIASFPDGADNVPLKGLTVAIEPVQSGSGDPSPTNIRPISGHTQAVVTRTGVNVWDEEWENTYYNDNGVKTTSNNLIGSKNFISVIPGATYYGHISYSTLTIAYFDEDKNFIRRITGLRNETFIIPDNCRYISIATAINYGGTYNHDISINYPATDTDYHEWHVQTVTIDMNGTIYGGTLDVTTGVLTVDRAIVDLGTLNWRRDDYSFWYSLGVRFISQFDAKAVCSALAFKGYSVSNVGDKNSLYMSGGRYIKVWDDTATSSADIEQRLSGVMLAYGVAPQTIQLTAQEVRTLLGTNNIWSDAGDVDVTYRADTKLYIEKLTAPTEDDMLADANIVSGQYFMVGNTLYKATANIASGGAITPNVNCTRKSLPEALNEINA